MPTYIRVKQIDPDELKQYFVDSITSNSGQLINYINQNSINLTGDNFISGDKYFNNNLLVSGTGSFLELYLRSNSNTDTGVRFLVTGDDFNLYNRSGAKFIIRNIESNPYTGKNAIELTNNNTTLKIPANKNDFIAVNSEVIHVTGEETVSGSKTFKDSIYLSDLNLNDIDKLYISGIDIEFHDVNVNLEAANVSIANLVYATGNQTISGTKTFVNPIYFISGINTDQYGAGSVSTAGGYIDLRGNGGGKGGSIISRGAEQDADNPANGGSINLSAGAADGSPGGNINLIGGSDPGSPAGNINLSSGGGSINTSHSGGFISTQGLGGYIKTDGYDYDQIGGSIDTSAGNDGGGGSINLSAGNSIGGSIDLSDNDGANFSIKSANLSTQNDGSIYNKINEALYIRKNSIWEKVITDKDNINVAFNGSRAIKRQGSFYGINAGGTTISGFLNNLLFPFIQGSISLNSIALQEKGTTLTTVPFIGSITVNDDTITNLKYEIGANQVGSTVSNPGSSFSYSATSQSIASTTTISVEASSANNGSPATISSSQTINFEAPYYYGVGAANLTVAQIKALNKVLTYQPSSITQTFTTNNNYFYLAYPTNWGNLTSIKDGSLLSLFNDFTKTTNSTTFTLVNNSSIYSYNIYVFNNASTVSNYSITFNF